MIADNSEHSSDMVGILLETAANFPLPTTQMSSHRLKRAASGNVKTIWITPDGSDGILCLDYLTHNVSCESVTYAVQHSCMDNVHLEIHVQGYEDFVYYEQCANLSRPIFTQQNCSLNIIGHGTPRTMPIFACNNTHMDEINGSSNSSLTVDQQFLLAEILVCQDSKNCEGTQIFSVTNVHFLNVSIYISVASVDFDDVIFENVFLIMDGISVDECSFSCTNCHFQNAIGYRGNTSAGDAKEVSMHFIKCKSLSISMYHCILEMTTVKAIFYHELLFSLTDSKLFGLKDHNTEYSQIIIRQVEDNSTTSRKFSDGTIPSILINIRQVIIQNNFIAINSSDFNAAISIHLYPTLEESTYFALRDVNCNDNSALLDYKLTKVSNESYQILLHGIFLQNISLLENIGFSDIFRIRTEIATTINISNSYFIKNSLQDPFNEKYETDINDNIIYKTGVLAINISQGSVLFDQCTFSNNIGALGSGIYLTTPAYNDVSLVVNDCKFTENTALEHTGQKSGSGGTMFIQTNFVNVTITDSDFHNNKAAREGGSIVIESIFDLRDEQVQAQKVAETSNVIESTTIASDDDITEDNFTINMTWERICLPGLQGPKGFPGDMGSTGVSGERGAPGGPGPSGPSGEQGVKGEQGPQGPSAELYRRKRDAEPQGPSFEMYRRKRDAQLIFSKCPEEDKYLHKMCVRGLQGPRGPKGDTGPAGDRGSPGSPGFPGPPGPTGERGIQGEIGLVGSPGKIIQSGGRKKRDIESNITSNADCPEGPIGPKGDTGITGRTGATGASGMPGPAGPPGPRGPQGPPGDTGVPGKDIILSGPSVPTPPSNTSYESTTMYTTTTTITPKEDEYKVSLNRILFSMRNTIFLANEAGMAGGALLFNRLDGNLSFTLDNVKLINNTGGGAGGGIAIIGQGKTSTSWVNCTFLSNILNNARRHYSIHTGGSVFFTNQTLETMFVSESHISDNIAKGYTARGGGLYIETPVIGKIWLHKSILQNNAAYHTEGGAIAVTLEMVKSKYPVKPIYIYINDCSLISNTASSNGGFLSLKYSAPPRVDYTRSVNVNIMDTVLHSNGGLNGNLDSPSRPRSLVNGGAIYLKFLTVNTYNVHTITIDNSTFLFNNGYDGGAVKIIGQKSHLHILLSAVRFWNNTAVHGAGALEITQDQSMGFLGMEDDNNYPIKIQMINVTFESNYQQTDSDRAGKGGAMSIGFSGKEYQLEINLDNVNFVKNIGIGHGGGAAINVPHNNSHIAITNCTFIGNHVDSSKQGGALYVFIFVNPGTNETNGEILHIEGSKFLDNSAGEGGSIFQSSTAPYSGVFNLNNSTFQCCTETINVATNGSFIISSLTAHVKNTVMQEIKNEYDNKLCSIPGFVLDYQSKAHSLQSVTYNCDFEDVIYKFRRHVHAKPNTNGSFESGHSSTDSNITSSNSSPTTINGLSAAVIFCTRCKFQPYTTGDGSLFITNDNTSDTLEENIIEHGHFLSKVDPCRICPFGGDCREGKVRARPNYWGYKHKGLIEFATCPQGYCCNDINFLCDSYDTCALHRVGRLCGKCEQNYTVSLMSRTCIPDHFCKDWWIWPLGIIVALSYLMWYMYKSELIPILEWVIAKLSTYRTKRDNIVHVQEFGGQKTEVYFFESDVKMQKQVQPKKRIVKGYFDIIVYFVNIISIIKVKVEFKETAVGSGFLYDVEKYFTRYLDVDMQEVANITVCPYPDLSTAGKTMARPIFVFMILTIWLLLYLSNSMIYGIVNRKKNIHDSKFGRFKLKLIEGYIETMKYNYSGLAGVTFLYLTCINIGDSRYWKYDAEIKCFSSWQWIVLAIATIYILPFPFTTLIGMKLLQYGQIGPKQLMMGLVFPLPYCCIWITKFAISRSANHGNITVMNLAKSAKHLVFSHTLKLPVKDDYHLHEKSKVILNTFQGPYKKENSSWESVIELRKLSFNMLYLLNNNIYRLVISSFFAISILVHHAHVLPFINPNSNKAELLSLALLTIVCITNTIKMVFIEFGIPVEPDTPTEQLIYLLNRLDRIMIIILFAYIGVSELYYIIKGFHEKRKDE